VRGGVGATRAGELGRGGEVDAAGGGLHGAGESHYE
jgi:hypothetical protein